MKHHAVTLEQVVRVMNGMGVEGFQQLSGSLPPANVKHGTRTLGQVEAYLNMVAPTDLDELLAGDAVIKIERGVKLLVDKNGRCIPSPTLAAAVRDPDSSFLLNQPVLASEADYANRLLKLRGNLGIDAGVSAAQFKLETERFLAELSGKPQIANLRKGVCLPLVLPRLDKADLGKRVELLVEAAGASYMGSFPGRAFNNLLRGSLAKQVSVVAGSRHKQLLEALEQGPVIALHFPGPLQGFSINAQREHMVCLPEELVLSGVDTLVAAIMYPEVLFRDVKIPVLDLAALSWRSADDSLCFKAYDDKLDFYYAADLAYAYAFCSGGLVLWKRRN